MHDEDENGGGNTSSSQPDNIGVANEDDDNDVDVVKQWGIRHGEDAAMTINHVLFGQICPMRQRREEVMVAQQGLAASSITGSCFLGLVLHQDVLDVIVRHHLRDSPWSTILFASCCKALWSVPGLPLYLDFLPPRKPTGLPFDDVRDFVPLQRTLKLLKFWYLLCEPHFVLHNLEMQLNWDREGEFGKRFPETEYYRPGAFVSILVKIVFCKSLQRLDITYCRPLRNCQVLAEANSVHTMRLISCEFLVDLGGLGVGCQNLTSLDLSCCHRLADLTGLSKCPVLSKIYLIDCRSVVDITPLAQCKVLHYLDLTACNKLHSVTSLGTGCVSESLQALVLKRCTALTDITGLDKCRSLQALTLSGCTGIKDVSPLLKCESLSNLVVGIESHGWNGMDQLRSSTRYSVDYDDDDDDEL